MNDNEKLEPVMQQAEMITIRRLIDGILNEAKEDKNKIEGAINWGDLTCVEVAHVFPDSGNAYITALIEEASPGSVELSLYVTRKLIEIRKEFGEIEIHTEW